MSTSPPPTPLWQPPAMRNRVAFWVIATSFIWLPICTFTVRLAAGLGGWLSVLYLFFFSFFHAALLGIGAAVVAGFPICRKPIAAGKWTTLCFIGLVATTMVLAVGISDFNDPHHTFQGLFASDRPLSTESIIVGSLMIFCYLAMIVMAALEHREAKRINPALGSPAQTIAHPAQTWAQFEQFHNRTP